MKVVVAVLALALAACSGTVQSATTSLPILASCQDPPAAEMQNGSALEMTVHPNPAEAGDQASLKVASTELPEDALAGVDAAWQCWNGSDWVTTHIVYRGLGDNPGQTIPINRSFQIRVPSIGLPLDEGYPIVIPQVKPGLYRIIDEIVVEDGSIVGFVILEVASTQP